MTVITVNLTMRDLFLASVERSGTCWIWQGSTDKDGYGRLQFGRRTLKAHRVAYELFVGPLSVTEIVRHTCDNPPCVNPDHLIAGTHADNQHDKVERGRSLRGERNPRAKLSADQVAEIRTRYTTEHVTQLALAKEYGVTQSHISWILRKASWEWL